MHDAVELIGIAVVLFVSTNVDDVFVLLGFFSDPKFRPRQVVAGQYAGILALFSVSIVASLLSLVVSPAYIGLLGVAPIFLGLKKLWELRRGVDVVDDPEQHRAGAAPGNVAMVAAVTIANGGDNISIYTPLFATRTGPDIAVIGLVFATMTALWLLLAFRLTSHPMLGTPIRRYGHWIVPTVLIGLGVLILSEAGTFELLRT